MNLRNMESLFDQSALETNFGGSENLKRMQKIILACVETFLATVDERIQVLQVSIETGDRATIELMAHQLRGSFLTLGGVVFARLLAGIEKESSSGKLEDLKQHLIYIVDNVGSYKVDLGAFVNTLKSDG